MVLNTKKTANCLFYIFQILLENSWKTPGKRIKKVLENPGFFKL
jgi:hypothetical protein